MIKVRAKIAIVVSLAFLFLAYWFGEGSFFLWPLLVSCALGFGAVVGLAPVRAVGKGLLGVGFLLAFIGAYLAGQWSFTQAFNECVDEGESVRVLLRAFYDKTGHYPEHLADLDGRIPCKRILRPTILRYEKTANGYTLSFRDFLVEHKATEGESFFASK